MIHAVYEMFLKNGFVLSFMLVGVMMFITQFISDNILKNKIPGVALAIALGLILASFGEKRGLQIYHCFLEWHCWVEAC